MLHAVRHFTGTTDTGLPPLIILHGMFGAGDNWLTIARELGQERPVYAIDLPGHGASPVGAGISPFHYRQLAAAVGATLAGLPDCRRVVLCGHSMGGKTAMTLALESPETVAGMIVVDTAPRSYAAEDFNHEVLALLSAVDPSRAASRLEFDTELKLHVHDPVMRGFLLKSLVQDGQGKWRWRFAAKEILAGARDIADWPEPAGHGSFDGPCRFIKGELSPYVDEARDMPAIRRLFPNADLRTVEQARHWVHFDNKSRFVALVRDFLA